jgi:hypothetical protein
MLYDICWWPLAHVSQYPGIAMSAHSPVRFLRFREERYWRGSQPVVGLAPREFVASRVSAEDLSVIFGGYVEYESADGNQRYLGVWGDRKVAQFLRLLREGGAAIEVEGTVPVNFRQRHQAVRSKRTIRLAEGAKSRQ